MTLGLFGFVINGLLLLLIAWVANTWFDIPFTIAGFPDKALSVDAIIAAIVALDRDEPHHHGHRARRPRLGGRPVTPDALRAAAGASARRSTSRRSPPSTPPRRSSATPSPTRGCAPTRSRRTTSRRSSRGSARAGLGANVVSRGEWAAARRAGIGNDRITLEGIGKTAADLRAAVRAASDGDPLRWVAVESPEEVAALLAIARRAGLGSGGRPPLDVLLRLNPDVHARDARRPGRRSRRPRSSA